MLALWRAGSAISLLHSRSREARWREHINTLLPEDMQEHLKAWIEQAEDAPGTPVTKVTSLLDNIVQLLPRQEVVAHLCADVILVRSLGWGRPLPLFGLHLKGKTLRTAAKGEDIQIACHQAVAHASQDAVRLAFERAKTFWGDFA